MFLGPPSDVQILKIRMSAFNDLTVTVSAIEQNTELYYEFIFENQTVIYNGKSSNSTLIIPEKISAQSCRDISSKGYASQSCWTREHN